MDPLRDNLREALNFSANEKRGILVLIFIMLISLASPRILKKFKRKKASEEVKISYLQYKKKINQIQREKKSGMKHAFVFDPNTINIEEAKKLPIPNYLVKRMINFREKAGPYKQKEDLIKLYGMTTEYYNRIVDYMKINEVDELPEKKIHKREAMLKVDINLADSTEFTALKGIGPVYASRIIKYRELLGGYVRKDQVLEVYGISDSLFDILEPSLELSNSNEMKRINLNKAGFDQIKKHPYLRNYNLARAIINYRSMHGDFQSLDDLKKIHLINDSIYLRISPYLKIE